MNGKGDRRRPALVPDEVVADNWARTFGHTEYTLGPRVVMWSCHACGTYNEWWEDSGKPRVCYLCKADPDDNPEAHGVYTITSIGGAETPWRARR